MNYEIITPESRREQHRNRVRRHPPALDLNAIVLTQKQRSLIIAQQPFFVRRDRHDARYGRVFDYWRVLTRAGRAVPFMSADVYVAGWDNLHPNEASAYAMAMWLNRVTQNV